ncbi:GntR family transcriptional regulator [Streptomyces sp. NL15-2K]|uniref:GntR family transcriptional regulator n=1 Tax=Streptomyces sp. NL15-2K TaxID=376149 RepID=UPI00155B3F76|nr:MULTISPECIES: GntR family transcriptional regulator [Actinomycetes]WKX06746.1 GntR family transcriptional regulator [Kutzneria buriramensis]
MVERSPDSLTSAEAGSEAGQGTITLEAVHELLRNRILHGELPPGAVVSQADLSRDLGVSRSPIREACRLLEREGLVVSRHNRRVQVADFSLDDLEELYASRLVLEPLVLTVRVASLTERELEQMATALEEMRQSAEQRDYDRFTAPHERYHALLYSDIDGRLLRQIKQLADHASRYRRVYMTQTPSAWDVVLEHDTRILQAVSRGDAVGAGAELARHLAATALSMMALMDPLHDPRLLRAALHQACHSEGGTR